MALALESPVPTGQKRNYFERFVETQPTRADYSQPQPQAQPQPGALPPGAARSRC
jgi:hypothetical protein